MLPKEEEIESRPGLGRQIYGLLANDGGEAEGKESALDGGDWRWEWE